MKSKITEITVGKRIKQARRYPIVIAHCVIGPLKIVWYIVLK